MAEEIIGVETNNLLKNIQNGQAAAKKHMEKAEQDKQEEKAKQDEQIALDNKIADLLKLGVDRKKEVDLENKKAQGEQLQRLNDFKITNSDGTDPFYVWGQDRMWLLKEEINNRLG